MRLRDLLYLNKSDRQVFLQLLSLAVIALAVLYFTGNGKQESREDEKPTALSQERADSSGVEERIVERFTFDPNTADSAELRRLGLRSWQIRNIYKYRSAGGVYQRKEDFAQLYGLTVKEYRELEPYIRISKDYLPASTLFRRSTTTFGDRRERSTDSIGRSQRRDMKIHYQVKLREGETVDINLSDTTALKTIPGIGSYYARRIVEYGRRLGGYVSVDQLDEIEGFPPDAKAFAVVSQPHPRQLNVNTLTLNELRRHPYINFYQARAITDYRRLHGPVSSLSELRLLPEFPPEVISRLEPYVCYE